MLYGYVVEVVRGRLLATVALGSGKPNCDATVESVDGSQTWTDGERRAIPVTLTRYRRSPRVRSGVSNRNRAEQAPRFAAAFFVTISSRRSIPNTI